MFEFLGLISVVQSYNNLKSKEIFITLFFYICHAQQWKRKKKKLKSLHKTHSSVQMCIREKNCRGLNVKEFMFLLYFRYCNIVSSSHSKNWTISNSYSFLSILANYMLHLAFSNTAIN